MIMNTTPPGISFHVLGERLSALFVTFPRNRPNGAPISVVMARWSASAFLKVSLRGFIF